MMYHSDSTSAIIEAWDFDPATGGIEQPSGDRETDQ